MAWGRGLGEILAVGDCALVYNPKGGFYPPAAQHALREGVVVARNVAATLYGRPKKKPFRYTSLGQLAAIGRRTGVGNILGVNFSGFLTWWLWRNVLSQQAAAPGEEGPSRDGLDSRPGLHEGLRLRDDPIAREPAHVCCSASNGASGNARRRSLTERLRQGA